ncbi:MAG: SGNH/GDSL hydrolase family protein [Hyphomicrobiales bacterium]
MSTFTLRLAVLGTWALLPVYVFQGIGVRLRSRRMPPAVGPVRAQIGGAAPAMRLLVVGDSSVAGTAIARTEHGYAHQVAAAMAAATGRAVSYRAAGFPSATAGQLRDAVVPNLERGPFDAVVLAVGINDAKNWHTAKRWKREFGTLIYALKARFPDAAVLWSQNMSFRQVPVLPRALAAILGVRGDLFNAIATQLCRERGVMVLPRFTSIAPDAFAIDGFHPSETANRAWGEATAALLLRADGLKALTAVAPPTD